MKDFVAESSDKNPSLAHLDGSEPKSTHLLQLMLPLFFGVK